MIWFYSLGGKGSFAIASGNIKTGDLKKANEY